MSEHIVVTRTRGLVEIAIRRPQRRNAIDQAMYVALAEAFEAAEHDASVRVILIVGDDEVFTAGNDLGDFVSNPPHSTDFPTFRFMRAVIASTKPIVAGVAGLAVGIGTTLLLHCDLVVAARDARFVLPFVALGLVPEFASSDLLPELMGRQRAARHLLLGDPIDAETAYAYGLVSQLVDDGMAIPEAHVLAKRLLDKPPLALARARALTVPDRAAALAAMEREAAVFSECLAGPEFAEAAQAFFEKRPPRFAPAA